MSTELNKEQGVTMGWHNTTSVLAATSENRAYHGALWNKLAGITSHQCEQLPVSTELNKEQGVTMGWRNITSVCAVTSEHRA